MNENLKQAILKVKEMAEVQEKLTKAETLEGAYEIMQSVGSGFTLDEFKAAMEEMRPAKNKSNEKPSKEEMQKKKKEVNAKIKSILTDEQYKKYLDMRKKDNAKKKKKAKKTR